MLDTYVPSCSNKKSRLSKFMSWSIWIANWEHKFVCFICWYGSAPKHPLLKLKSPALGLLLEIENGQGTFIGKYPKRTFHKNTLHEADSKGISSEIQHRDFCAGRAVSEWLLNLSANEGLSPAITHTLVSACVLGSSLSPLSPPNTHPCAKRVCRGPYARSQLRDEKDSPSTSIWAYCLYIKRKGGKTWQWSLLTKH